MKQSESTADVIRGATDRRTNFSSAQDQQDEKFVIEWLSGRTHTSILDDPKADYLKRIVTNEIYILKEDLFGFRGRYEEEDMKPTPMPEHFGPPGENCSAQRYNDEGLPALYLSTDKIGVYHELKQKHSPNRLLCQKFHIKRNDIKIADFRPSNCSNFLNIVFDYSEYGMMSGEINFDNYDFSRAVAKIINCSGYDGMVIPGVRGNKTCHYSNIILFNRGCSEFCVSVIG